MSAAETTTSGSDGQPAPATPSISLPKGGGAIRGMGEKFAANPITGTGSMSIPLATSPGRAGFGPQLSLSYDSGSGNGPFGFGWSLSLPAITRKTDKGLPRYRDVEESDVFVLSGAEDLVPLLRADGTRFEDDTSVPGFVIHRYRPRVEGLFARIERWTRDETGEAHWRVVSRDNVTTLYGKDGNSRVSGASGIFSWLICETYDDKGKAIVYQYAAEDAASVDLGQANERNRSRPAGRYLKRIHYGNLISRLIQPDLSQATWLFDVVFDYDEAHCEEVPLDPARSADEQHRFVRASASAGQPWTVRPDPFSSYRAGFEVRSYRRCQRVLMFHHVPDLPSGEPGYDGLVRSTEFDYADLDYSHPVAIDDELAHQGSSRFASFIRSVTQSGFVRDDTQPPVVNHGVPYATYLKRSLPPLELTYSKAVIHDEVLELDRASLENLPTGLDGAVHHMVDLDGEGVSGILAEQGDAWYYKANLGDGRFGALETVALKPSLAALSGGHQQLVDLAGDGQLDLAAFAGPVSGFYERTLDAGWEPFRSFHALPNAAWDDPNLRFVDLDGDGRTDVLIAENEVFTWHVSLAEDGFGPALRVGQPGDEERGPRLMFADGEQSVYLADMCGDGLADLVRIRNGEVCYWPNLGYGRFGAKVTMDNAPRFDWSDRFEQRRVRLGDIDGSGTNDVIYLGSDGVRVYFNQSGNRWSDARPLAQFPHLDNVSSVQAADLLGNGTACLVWSSPLPADARHPLRYIDLMSGTKPHLLVGAVNNLGAETRVQYAPSTRFYLADKREGRPWITRLPFPVHVVERVETYDHISGNRFVTRHAYHQGYFDGVEREFRGFGLMEQWDTEELAALSADSQFPAGTNVDASSHVPPVYTRSWFHTGVFLDRARVSGHYANEYYREPGLGDSEARALLLEDTVLPDGLTADEEREACRALKGALLRQEIFALDGTTKAAHPYTVTEQNLTIRLLQPQRGNRHAVFLVHAREALSYHYEREPADPRVGHALTLEVDDFGNVLTSATVGYGRRQPDPALTPADQAKQTGTLLTYTEQRYTNAVEVADAYRTPLPAETRTFELSGLAPSVGAVRFTFGELLSAAAVTATIAYEQSPTPGAMEKRLIEHARTAYRRDDLTGLLPPGTVESLALPGESYKLAFTPGLARQIYVDSGKVRAAELDDVLAGEGRYVHSPGDTNWWIPSGRIFFSQASTATPADELDVARRHFFLPRCYRDPFHTNTVPTESFVSYDAHDLLMVETRDAVGNVVTAATADDAGSTGIRIDYRVLQPYWMTDPNGNRAAVAIDALGMVVGTAVMGKPPSAPVEGDSLDGFEADLTEAVILDHLANPLNDPQAILGRATTRLVYDLFAYQRTKHQPEPQPAAVYTLARETHDSDPVPAGGLKIQRSFSYSDGFSREIQKKVRAEPGPVPMRDRDGEIIVGADGQPVMTPHDGARWVGSGWRVFNNKEKPVRQYEPFFTDTHRFEFDVRIGVSPVLFYDPSERAVATLHPDHTWEKVVFDPWRQEAWDASDTMLVVDPKTDPDAGDFFRRLPEADYLPTWHTRREGGVLGPQEQAAAGKAAIHAQTPSVVYADSLGRSFHTVVHNKFKFSGTPPADPPVEELHRTRVNLDIEGNQREVIDARDRVVMRYEYDMLGTRIHQSSMEAGERRMLSDVAGKPIRGWDDRGHTFRTEYDPLRRPLRSFVQGADPQLPAAIILVGKTEYGEGQPNDAQLNLRTRAFRQFDSAGVATTEGYDFKGNLLRSSRRLAQDYKTIPNWSASPAVELETFTSRTSYDALNRPLQLVAPHSDQPGAKRNVVQPAYNEANLLDQVHVWLDRPTEPAGLLDVATVSPSPVGVNKIDYDAKGQRLRIAYKNGATTRYVYDPETFRLIQLYTRRGAAFTGDCENPDPPPATIAAPDVPPLDRPGGLQNLRYTYDPVGNVTHIRDNAQQTIYFNNQVVPPENDYTYDAVYRLINAEGREHIGQAVKPETTWTDEFRVSLQHPQDGTAMRNYTERYEYDAAGNFERLIHHFANGGWTRDYVYDETSLIDATMRSNRLSSTTVGQTAEHYSHDSHGNMTAMPHLTLMRWNFLDQLSATSRQAVNAGTPETTYYVYDGAGKRVRKVTERENGTRKNERTYLAACEVYREYDGNGSGVRLERETLHVMDAKQRIALVETKTLDVASPLVKHRSLMRYQFANHLGSASLELDDEAQIISYEEYYPYGSTSYQAVRSKTEAAKRYRFTAMERDEESGLTYHSARYYIPWIQRWLSCDPVKSRAAQGLYEYCSGNPIRFLDQNGEDALEAFGDALKALGRDISGEIFDYGAAIERAQRLFDQHNEGMLRQIDTDRSGRLDAKEVLFAASCWKPEVLDAFLTNYWYPSKYTEAGFIARDVVLEPYYRMKAANRKLLQMRADGTEDTTEQREAYEADRPRHVFEFTNAAFDLINSIGISGPAEGGSPDVRETPHGAPLEPGVTGSGAASIGGSAPGASSAGAGAALTTPEEQWIRFSLNKAQADAFRLAQEFIDTKVQPTRAAFGAGGGTFKWGVVFNNRPADPRSLRAPELPATVGPYREHYVLTPGQIGAGTLRLVTGAHGESFITWTHYGTAQPAWPIDPHQPLARQPFLRSR